LKSDTSLPLPQRNRTAAIIIPPQIAVIHTLLNNSAPYTPKSINHIWQIDAEMPGNGLKLPFRIVSIRYGQVSPEPCLALARRMRNQS
jgi:hypothetical protein